MAEHEPEHLEYLAKQAAEHVGCEAQRWWLDTSDPRFLRIEASPRFPVRRPFSVYITAAFTE